MCISLPVRIELGRNKRLGGIGGFGPILRPRLPMSLRPRHTSLSAKSSRIILDRSSVRVYRDLMYESLYETFCLSHRNYPGILILGSSPASKAQTSARRSLIESSSGKNSLGIQTRSFVQAFKAQMFESLSGTGSSKANKSLHSLGGDRSGRISSLDTPAGRRGYRLTNKNNHSIRHRWCGPAFTSLDRQGETLSSFDKNNLSKLYGHDHRSRRAFIAQASLALGIS